MNDLPSKSVDAMLELLEEMEALQNSGERAALMGMNDLDETKALLDVAAARFDEAKRAIRVWRSALMAAVTSNE